MFEDYKLAVLGFYLEKKEKHLLSSHMESPGREKLKKECLVVFAERNSKKDKEILQSFFDPTSKYDDLIKSIEKYDLDKFRPLINLLIRGVKTRHDENYKLLAWLINYPNYEDWKAGVRPKDPPKKDEDPPNPGEGSENPDTGNDLNSSDIDPPTGGQDKGYKSKNIRFTTFRLAIIICILLLLIGRFSYFAWGRTQGRAIRMPRADEKCMYWVGNHYEPVRCDDRSINAVKIPLNLETLKSLEKINEADTLTKADINKKWYAKINGKPEYFTAGGMHPVDTAKRLLPLSNHIVTKYILDKFFLLSPLGWLYYSSLFLLLGLLGFDFLRRKQQKG